MRRILLLTPLVVLADTAIAHLALAPHEHPHATSALAGLNMLLLAGLIIGFGAAVVSAFRQR